jgi:intracellular septation protein A
MMQLTPGADPDPAFIKIKPTLIYLVIGFVMLRPGWMDRYLPPQAHAHGADITRRFGYIWAGLCFATAGANMAFALLASFTAWAWFIFVFPTASKIMLVLIQYAVTRRIIRRRLRDPAAATA